MEHPESGSARPKGARFGAFEVDFETGELRKHGLSVPLQDKPLRLLQALIERPGRVVTHSELRDRLWPRGHYIDHERNLKIALSKLRAALCDPAVESRYIETLPRHGYRFIADVELGESPPHVGAGIGPRRWPRRSKRIYGALARIVAPIVAVAILAVLLFRVLRPSTAERAESNEPSWVLIAHFENQTGEPQLGSAVEYALRRELSNSRHVSVVPRERVQDALQLMKRPADATLDRALGREVCLRDGGIRAFIAGQIEKLGTQYVLSADVVEPASGVQVAGGSVEAQNLDAILPAVRELSNRLRELMGEKLSAIREGNLKLEKVTTPSLRALELYSQAMSMTFADKWAPAAALLSEAVTVDPEFASAHILLAHCESNLGYESVAAPHYCKAFELAPSTSDRERYFILGSYYQRFAHDNTKAIQAYEALLHLYPGDYWAVNNLISAQRAIGHFAEAAEATAVRANLRPREFALNFAAWQALARIGHVAEAEKYLDRAKALLTPEAEKAHPREAIDLAFLPATQALGQAKLSSAVAEAERLGRTVDARPADERDELAEDEGELYLSMGSLKKAGDWYERVSVEGGRYFLLADVAESKCDRKSLESNLLRQLGESSVAGPGMVARLAGLGLLPQAQAALARLSGEGFPPADRDLASGALALAKGHRDRALELLQRAVAGYRDSGNDHVWMAADLLATAEEQMGNIPGAIRVLEFLPEDPLQDTAARFHLARLYRSAGRGSEAERIEASLLSRLAYADSDFPLLVELKRLHAAPSVAQVQ